MVIVFLPNALYIDCAVSPKKKKHFVRLYTYIFGSERSVSFETEYSLKEIEEDFELKTKLINEALIKESNPVEGGEEWFK